MSAVDSSNKRIAKNTLFLYLRMLIVMGVTVYSARVVLDTLGIDDYGIYNLVGGVVVLFNFLNSSMTTCTQRYLCVAIGKEDSSYERNVFSTSIIAHILISGLFLLLAETLGLWFVKDVLNIPSESKNIAVLVYQISVLSAIANIIRVPFNGAIIANERMSFYAYSSIVETVLKLIILVPLVWIDTNKLILYAVLVAVVNFIVLIWYRLYVYNNFENCRIEYRNIQRLLLKEMLKFTGWSNFSSISNLGAKQGMGFILNHFMGVVINATVGIMNQVTTAVYGFINNFMTAVNPPLIKLFVSKQMEELENLLIKASKFSYYLMLLLSIPLIMNIDAILSLWLKDIPIYSNYFCVFSLLSLLPNVIGGPIWTIIQASGDIKKYQMIIGCVILCNLPADYLLLYYGMAPYWPLIVAMVVNIIVDLIGMKFVIRFTCVKSKTFAFKIVFPCIFVTIVSLILSFLMHNCFELYGNSFPYLLLNIAMDAIVVIVASLFLGLTRYERKALLNLVKARL